MFEEYDCGHRGHGWSENLRVRVTLDISRPLRRAIKVNIDGSLNGCWSQIKYERLPELCSFCGIIGHGVKDCTVIFKQSSSSTLRMQYGQWMHYTGRVSSIYRSPSKSPIQPTPNEVQALQTTADQLMAERTTRSGSPMGNSGSKPMDISLAKLMQELMTETMVVPEKAREEKN